MEKNRNILLITLAVVLVLAAMTVAAVFLLSSGDADSDWQEQYDLGRRYLEEGNYEEAILAFSAAIEIDHKRPEAYLGRGEAYMELGEYEKAKEDFEKAQRRGSDDEEIIEKIAEIEKRTEEAEEKNEQPTQEQTQPQVQESIKKLTYMYYTDGGYIEEWSFSYSEEGLMTGAVCYGYYDGDGRGIPDVWEFEYNEEGKILRAECSGAYGSYRIESYHYQNGLLVQKAIDTEYGVYDDYYEYDGNGNLVRSTDGEFEETTDYTYENNLLVKSVTTSMYRNLTTTYKYDRTGKLIESTVTDHDLEYGSDTYTYDDSYPLFTMKHCHSEFDGHHVQLIPSDIPVSYIYESYMAFRLYGWTEYDEAFRTENGYLSDIIFEDMFLSHEFRYEEIGGDQEIRAGTKNEAELLEIMELTAGTEIAEYVYLDMDHDGIRELIGVCQTDAGVFQSWYCSSDGSTCEVVSWHEYPSDSCAIEILELEEETHVALNTFFEIGTQKYYTILALKNGIVNSVVTEQYGYVYMNDDGDILLNVEAYDGIYDTGSKSWLLHTWKDTYLYYNGTRYGEYGAKEISESEFLKYENAEILKAEAIRQVTGSDTTQIALRYYVRSNGIAHIQCEVHNSVGEISYMYFTVKYKNRKLETDIGVYNYGRMEESFSTLNVQY